MNHEFPDPTALDTISYNPSFETLRACSKSLETPTEYGSPAYVTRERSRSADRTKNTIDHDLDASDHDHIERAQHELRTREFVCLDRRMGRHPDLSFNCRFFVPREQARIGLSWASLLEPAEGDPDFRTLQIPNWPDTRIRVFPEDGVTYILGSDYTGEAKKSFLRLFMYYAKQRGGLGLHAGSKRVIVDNNGRNPVGQLFLGLSATGKTTLTCHHFSLTPPEKAEVLQDDVCALLADGTAAGSEGGGLYIKTMGLSEDNHAPLYHAATQPGAVLENVHVDADGSVDFEHGDLTTNGRASVRRADLPNAADDINLDAVDHVFFITRNPLMPPIAKLAPEEGAAAFMLGESIQTSAGDPDRAGEAIRVVGTNPFIIGSKGEEGNRFLGLVKANDIRCYLINTGDVGGKKDITVRDTVALLRGVARGAINWRFDDQLALHIPQAVPGIDVESFYPPDYVDDYESNLETLRADRRQFLESFPDLDSAILNTPLVAPVSRTQTE